MTGRSCIWGSQRAHGHRASDKHLANVTDNFALPPSDPQEHWYAAYTCANHEKRVNAELQAQKRRDIFCRSIDLSVVGMTAALVWSCRCFPGYVFVRITVSDRLRVLQIPGVVQLVGFNGRPAALPDDEMDILRSGFSRRLRAEPHAYLAVGRRVRLRVGRWPGLRGSCCGEREIAVS